MLKLKRMDPCAVVGVTPMARRTWEGSREPEEQADRGCAAPFSVQGKKDRFAFHKFNDTTATTAMSAGEKGKNKTRMNGYPVSWNRIRTQRNIERTGPDLPASGGLIQKIGACPGLDPGRLTP